MALEILAIVVTPINEVGKCLFGSLNQQIRYLTSYSTNIQNLQNQVSELQQTRQRVQTLADAAQRNSDELFLDVQKWLEDTTVEKVEEQQRHFIDEVNINEKCFKGLCPDLSSRLRLSKQAVRLAETFHTLQEKGNNFPETGISHPRPPPNVELVRTTTIVENILPRDSLMNALMRALGDSNITSIGVHGMGGIGKTTLVEKINNELDGHKLFNKVIMVIVSKDPDLMKIQDDVARRLGMNLEATSTNVRASRLFERLKTEEKLLIILDDVWKPLKVEDIGLSRGCKLVVTTRMQEVCVQMKLQKIIKVEPLSEGESCVLFKSKAGDVVTLPNLKPIAEKIVEKCKGSPLAIVALGSALTSVKEEYVWNNALSVLSNPTRSDLEGIMPEVVTSLSFSFERLESLEIKKCFLFCCLFPEDYNINLRDLRDYGIGERFLKVGGTLDNASDKLLSFIKKLKDCCLLLEGDEEYSVKMHDVVRDVAICIGGDAEYGFLVNVGGGLIKFRESEDLKEKKRISFMKHSKDVLRDPLECPQLKSLLIRENDDIRIDQESFFEDNKSLEVLDLRRRWKWDGQNRFIIPTPQSISCLTNLKTLHLVGCDVSDKISLLGGLRKLEILKLSNSIVKTLPEEIGNLANLRSLDLNEAELSFVAPNVISKLSYLEEFYMDNKYTEWDTMTRGGEYNASLKEVELLSRLSRLTICIKGTETEPHVSWLNNLKQLIIKETNTQSYYSKRDPQHQCVRLNGVNPLEYWHWVYKLISTSVGLILVLDLCFGIKNVADLIALRDLKQLEKLVVYGCDDIEYVINIDESNKDSQDSFNTLEKITLYCLDRMKKIYHGPTPSTGFFGQLRILDVFGCNQIKNIFSANLLLAIKRLEHLHVQYCSSLKEIVGGENEDEVPGDHSCLLPQLKTLELWGLRSLTSFYQGDIPIGCPLEKIVVRECRNLKKFPLAPQTASHLQTFEVETDWFDALEWADQSHKAIFQPFFEEVGELSHILGLLCTDALILINTVYYYRIVEEMTSDEISQEMAAEPVVEKIKETTTEFSCNPLTISMASAEIIVVLALEIKLSIKVTVLVVKDISQTMCKTMGTRTVH
ncbi:hypothetical protein AQUCO_03300012v1 [Aquilegia coerulea]|uniref:Uncharacterized protein n=1 Tax=Aquilegia coerulea TaxID=218851 RepID=A0A2G5CZ37_AQUCA|nr:hypothetical protein AQUCO_03300012v1 [Aquilegia coerulea]